MEDYIKNIKDFCHPETYGKGIKILGSGVEGIATKFKLKNGKIIVMKGIFVNENHLMLGKLLSIKHKKKSYKLWKKLADKFDFIIKPYRQEFCEMVQLKPAKIELIAMEYGDIDLNSYILKNKKSVKWWKDLSYEIIKILEELKKNNITHGDFRFNNILIINGNPKKLKLIDFTFIRNKYDKSDLQRIIGPFINKFPSIEEENDIFKKVPKEITKIWIDYGKKNNIDTKQIKF